MLSYIIIASLLETAVALVGILAVFIGFEKIKKYTHHLISFAAGTFLGLVFFDLIPESVELSPKGMGTTYVLIGFLIFFVISRAISWYHHHESDDCTDDCSTINVSTILIADTLHNFADGIIIAIAFLTDINLGIATTIAVLFHELPQEIADFFVLINKGMTKTKALSLNFAVSLTTPIGAVLAFVFVSEIEWLIGPLLGLAAGNFLYIAASDLIPELHSHHRKGAKSTVQLALLFFGVALIYIVGLIGTR